MCKCFDLKSIVFGVAFAIGSFFAIANISVLKSSVNSLSNENLTETKTIATPISQAQSDFRPDGGFEFGSKPPEEFKEISWLSMITGSPVGYGSGCAPSPCTLSTPRVEERVNWVSQTPRGLLVTDKEMYSWKVESISVENFSFETETKKGQNYYFTGHFISAGIYDETKPRDAVLIGLLTRKVDGKIVAEQEVSFKWFSWEEVDSETYSHKKPK